MVTYHTRVRIRSEVTMTFHEVEVTMTLHDAEVICNLEKMMEVTMDVEVICNLVNVIFQEIYHVEVICDEV